MLPKSSARIRASDTASGDDEWIGQGMAHRVRRVPGRKPGLDWDWALGHVFGKEFVNGVQRLGHGNRELGWMWRKQMVCKGCRS